MATAHHLQSQCISAFYLPSFSSVNCFLGRTYNDQDRFFVLFCFLRNDRHAGLSGALVLTLPVFFYF